MTKSLHNEDSKFSVYNHPGCIRTILHHFHHHRWLHVTKKLPHRRHTTGKHASADREPSSSHIMDDARRPDNSSAAEMAKLVAEARVAEPDSGHKTSMKSRLKALISEEKSKRKDGHRRTSSHPAQLQTVQTNFVNYHESAGHDSVQRDLNYENPGDKCNAQSSICSLFDPGMPNVYKKVAHNSNTCDMCAAMLTMNYLRQDEVSREGNQPVKDHTVLQNKSIYAIKPSKTASLQESKLFLEALDLLNMRKELFLNVLKDPKSSLSHQFHDKRLLKLKVELNKSTSFPVPGSLRGRSVMTNDAKYKQAQVGDEAENSRTFASAGELKEHSANFANAVCGPEECQRQTTPLDVKSRHGKRLGIKRFKNIGEKLKLAINESKKERQRIVKDAVLHKIPYGRKSTKGSKGQTGLQEKPEDICYKSSPGSLKETGLEFYRRTSSFNESFDKYNQLLESESNGEVKSQTSDRSSLKIICSNPKKLVRLVSLPDIRLYYDTPCDTPKHSSFENPSQMDTISEVPSVENFVAVGENYDDSGGLNLTRSASSHDINNEDNPISFSVLENPILVPSHDLISQQEATDHTEFISEEMVQKDFVPNEDDSLTYQQHELEKAEAQLKQLYNDVIQHQVDIKNKAEFDYVRDVLELSGFISHEYLGKWHSAEQPLNHSVFVEVEQHSITQPKFHKNEVYENCDHVLLFDLINEVLLDIYGKSSSYWPIALTRRSCINPMPVGYRVLEDVWADISYYLKWRPEFDQTLDDPVNRDLSKRDSWMNLQFDAECVGLELEELVLDDLLQEVLTDFGHQVSYQIILSA